MKLRDINEVLAKSPNNDTACYFIGYYGSRSTGVFVADNGKDGEDRLSAVFVSSDSNALGGTDEIENELSIFRGDLCGTICTVSIPGPITEEEANKIIEKLSTAKYFEAVATSMGIEFITY